VLTPQVTRVNRIEVGFRSGAAQPARGATASREVSDEALMLTGDENIIDINFVVLWRIADPAAFLFNIREPENTVKAAAESVMREIIGQTPIVQATTEGRRAIEQRAREQLQSLMNEYGAGIAVDEVQLLKADPPAEVIDAFRDVQRAQADRERAQNEAEAYANDVIPRARGDAERILQEAEAYRQEVVARSEGEAARFLSVLEQYSKSRDVTMKRIYLETMEDVLAGINKVIIDDQSAGSGVVPYLPLPDFERRAREAEPRQTGVVTGGAQ
jgi:modulator of FtsH protease HflK